MSGHYSAACVSCPVLVSVLRAHSDECARAEALEASLAASQEREAQAHANGAHWHAQTNSFRTAALWLLDENHEISSELSRYRRIDRTAQQERRADVIEAAWRGAADAPTMAAETMVEVLL